MYPHHHSIMQVTSTQEGRTRIPNIAMPCKHLICNIYTGQGFKNLLKHYRKISDPRGKQFALFNILLSLGHLDLPQLYVTGTLQTDVKMSSSILKSRVVKQTFVVNS